MRKKNILILFLIEFMKSMGFKYFKYLTFRKTLNIINTFISYGLSLVFSVPIVLNYPFILTIEPTNFCNLSCPQCPSGAGLLKRKKGHLKFNDFKKIIDELGKYLLEVLLYFQGEPFLNNDIFSMINYAKENKIMTTVNTNGNFTDIERTAENIVNSGLEKLIISLDGTNEITYNKYRKGGSFKRVLDGIQEIISRRNRNNFPRPLVFLQFLLMKHNEDELEEFKRLTGEIGCDGYIVKTVQIYPELGFDEFLPSKNELSRYTYDGEGINFKGKVKNRCKRVWANMVITWDGTFVPCCFDKDARYNLGNVFKKKNALSLWKAPASRKFRKRILQNQKQIDICNNCIETLKIPHIITRG
ncbi:radical SAM protein [candidate division KSB1 bacterium]|nr:MAG: radical SAM protein [candidate division KSB1 bacterium]